MPKAEEYPIEPSGDGEFYGPQTDNGDPLVHNSLILLAGSEDGSKAIKYWNVFLRVEPEMPDDAIWDYIQIRLNTYAEGGSGSKRNRYGILKRDGDWDQGTNGFQDWAIDTDSALADIGINGNRSEDLTVYWNDLPANSGGLINIPHEESVNVDQYLDDALPGVTLPNTSTVSFPGLLAHLQSYWDDAGNIATRGDGNTTDGVPIAIEFHTALNDGAANLESFQSWRSSIFGLPAQLPRVYFGWHNKEGAAVLSSASTMTTSGTVIKGLRASLTSPTTMSTVGQLTIAASAALASAATLTAIGHRIRNASAALASIATMTTTAGVIKGLRATLSSVSTMTPRGFLTIAASALLPSTSTLTVSAALVKAGAALLASVSTMVTKGQLIIGASVSMASALTFNAFAVIFRIGVQYTINRVGAPAVIDRPAGGVILGRASSSVTVSIPAPTVSVDLGSARIIVARQSPTIIIEVESGE